MKYRILKKEDKIWQRTLYRPQVHHWWFGWQDINRYSQSIWTIEEEAQEALDKYISLAIGMNPWTVYKQGEV